MSESFEWHAMDDAVPKPGKGRYLLLGHRGALHIANEYMGGVESVSGPLASAFHLVNNRQQYLRTEQVKAWAEVPPYEPCESNGGERVG